MSLQTIPVAAVYSKQVFYCDLKKNEIFYCNLWLAIFVEHVYCTYSTLFKVLYLYHMQKNLFMQLFILKSKSSIPYILVRLKF